MCWSHCNLFVNVRPKYLADVTDSSVCPPCWHLTSIVFFLLVTLSTVHLPGCNFMHHSFSGNWQIGYCAHNKKDLVLRSENRQWNIKYVGKTIPN
jgi:hypothetical protein